VYLSGEKRGVSPPKGQSFRFESLRRGREFGGGGTSLVLGKINNITGEAEGGNQGEAGKVTGQKVVTRKGGDPCTEKP